MTGARSSQFCGYFGGAEIQRRGRLTYQWPALLFTDSVILTGPIVEHPNMWRAGTVLNLATSYANSLLGVAGAPFLEVPKKRWGKADYMDVESIITELRSAKGESLTSEAAAGALGRHARALASEQITRAEVQKLKVRGIHLAYGQTRVRLHVADGEHLDWLFVRHLYDQVLDITERAFGDRVEAPTLVEAAEAESAYTTVTRQDQPPSDVPHGTGALRTVCIGPGDTGLPVPVVGPKNQRSPVGVVARRADHPIVRCSLGSPPTAVLCVSRRRPPSSSART